MNAVAWALPPGSKTQTRPAKLVDQLVRLGVVSASSRYYFHGRAKSSGISVNAGSVYPRVPAGDTPTAVFSPVFQARANASRLWSDFYDDWSLAPDINLAHRALSARTYREARKAKERSGLMTCNSKYMQAKLRLEDRFLVPNGVDQSLARVEHHGDSARRLIVLGHFFSGRTDFELLEKISREGRFDQIVIGSPGSSKEMGAVISSIRTQTTSELILRDWLELEGASQYLGPRTVALIPHVVSDYTLSQDLMKAYQYQALGIRVMCPRLLWPSGLDLENVLLLDIGVGTDAVREWVDSPEPTDLARSQFVDANSWEIRARQVVGLMGQLNNDN
ncbi:hypothetical protein KPL76_05845 [Subtercola sp. PAMC28395]|uniref:hypothetical protein n=1 Tax=Subtercola sp. PAMC28395 TaxID=2846775 RepID=UPI001C0CF424|nr:hypothetical protein [Subtercola sp. PAMC28395]QWT24880.1 hypothetical protein KPL76_05845 [Subtercola sp. PAMC28395]